MNEKQERTRKQIIAAAIDAFHANGFQKTRISDIVSGAGVAQGTFYIYFKSKEEIFNHICSEFTAMFLNLLENAEDLFAGATIEQIRTDLQAFIREVIILFTANYKMARLLFIEGSSYGGPFKGVYEEIYAQFIDRIGKDLIVGRERGHITFEDAETEAAFLIGLFDSSLFYFMRLKNYIDIEKLSHRMTDFVLGGLCKNTIT